MQSAPNKQFFGKPSDMIRPLPKLSASETEPFPAFDDTAFEDPVTPRPHQSRVWPQIAGNTSPSQPSPGTVYQVHDTVKKRLNAGYTEEQQEEIIKLVLESVVEQNKKTRKTTDDAMVYVHALEECSAILDKLHLEHEDAMLAFKIALVPVKAHLDSKLSRAVNTESSLRHQLSQAENLAFRTDGFTASESNGINSPLNMPDHHNSMRPIRSLNTITEEDDTDTPEPLHTNMFAHELPGHQRQTPAPPSPEQAQQDPFETYSPTTGAIPGTRTQRVPQYHNGASTPS